MLPVTSQEKYQNKMTDAGLYKMSVWIPEADRERLSKYAQRLRNGHLKKREANENTTDTGTK